MDDSPRSDTTSTPASSVRKKSGKGVLWGMIALFIAFAAGFLWQFYEATTVREQLTATEQELVEERLRVRLGQAALAAQSGEYEAARQQMSDFFSHAQDAAHDLDPEVRGTIADFLAMRDEIITGLSRSNPEFAGVLYGMLETLGNAIDGPSEPAVGEGMPTGEGEVAPAEEEGDTAG